MYKCILFENFTKKCFSGVEKSIYFLIMHTLFLKSILHRRDKFSSVLFWPNNPIYSRLYPMITDDRPKMLRNSRWFWIDCFFKMKIHSCIFFPIFIPKVLGRDIFAFRASINPLPPSHKTTQPRYEPDTAQRLYTEGLLDAAALYPPCTDQGTIYGRFSIHWHHAENKTS